MQMDQEIAVKRLSELGHSTRLSVFRLLVKAGPSGLAVGEVQKHLEIAAPTLSHHLQRLMSAGFIIQKREGRILYCIAKLDALLELTQFLESECCSLSK